MTLAEHRRELAANPDAYTRDVEERCYRTVVSHLKKVGYPRITLHRAEKEVQDFVNLIFESQNHRPFFYIDGELPYCWNAPKNFHLNYIRYEWGHLRSRNQNGKNAHCLENLCLQSARCNQHIQSSLNVEELLHYGGRLEKAIRENLERRRRLFKSEQWRNLTARLDRWR